MTDYDLDQLERLEFGASRKGWTFNEYKGVQTIAYQIPNGINAYKWQQFVPLVEHYTPGVEADITFIVFLRNAAPELFADLRRLKEREHDLEQACSYNSDAYDMLEKEYEKSQAEVERLQVADIDKIAANLREMRLLEENKRLKAEIRDTLGLLRTGTPASGKLYRALHPAALHPEPQTGGEE